jgi:hypothetical protein
MSALINLAGKRVGRWNVLAQLPERRRYGRNRHAVTVLWLCRCDCGVERAVHASNLLGNKSRSCGCAAREQTAKRSLKHGHARRGHVSRVYRCWQHMLRRCSDPRDRDYRNYSGRGIVVCERWLVFANFLHDMGEPPPGMSNDRIDPNGNYEPTNCQWATCAQQAANRRPRRRRSSLADILKYKAAVTHGPSQERTAP